MTSPTSITARPRPRPSDAIDGTAWSAAHDRLVESLQALIRIPTVNPAEPAGAELAAANWIGSALADAGVSPTVYEPVPGRGSVVARLRGDGTGGEPLLLLSHLDVVPAAAERWTHDPFGGDIADGYVFGRGAVDMKDLVAMELEVVRLLAAEARGAGRDPASDPIPGLRRDVLLASTADEEAGGFAGAAWLASEHPEHLRAAGAINEAGGVSVHIGDRRIYPIQIGEKGVTVYRITVHGSWGHGSMPREDNAAVLAAEAIRRLAIPGTPRVTDTMRRFFEGAAAATTGRASRALLALAEAHEPAALQEVDGPCAPGLLRTAAALIRDTVSPDVVHAGVKYNVIPGEAVIEVDCRRLAGTSEPEMRAELVRRLGPDLAPRCDVDLVLSSDALEAPADSPLFRELAAAITDHDPEGVALPITAPFGTDAKHIVDLGVPVYGFSPLRMAPGDGYLELYHAVDERVSLDALRWGLPVLYDAVRRFCG